MGEDVGFLFYYKITSGYPGACLLSCMSAMCVIFFSPQLMLKQSYILTENLSFKFANFSFLPLLLTDISTYVAAYF